MENSVDSTIVRPFKNISCDIRSHALYKILQGYRVGKSDFLISIKNILNFIDNNYIDFSHGNINLISKIFSSAVDVSLDRIIIINHFLFGEKLIAEEEEKLVLTPYGRLFLISDDISSTIDVIRYYWEKSDWKTLSGATSAYKFLSDESRRYMACLLYQLEGQIVDFDSIKVRYSHIDLIDFNNYYVTQDILNNNYVKYIFENIFEPLGLMKVVYNEKKDKYDVKLSIFGKEIFEFYSYNMREEYTALLDEAWECYDRGNFQDSFDIAKNVISVTYNIPEIYNLIGCVYIKMKQYSNAMDIFKLAIELCDGSSIDVSKNNSFNVDEYVSLYYNLGLCHYYMGDYINALHIFKDVKKTVPYTLENIEDIIVTIKKSILIRPVQA